MVGIVVAMFVLNYWLALASLLVVPIMFWFTRFVARYTRKGFRDLQRELGQLNGVMEEAISGQRTSHAFRRKDAAIEAFRRGNQQVFGAGVYANSYALLLMPITSVLGNLFVIVLAGLGGWLALSGLVSVGIIATFISYGQSFVQPLRQLANLYNSIQAALAGAERIFAIVDLPPELDGPAEVVVDLEDGPQDVLGPGDAGDHVERDRGLLQVFRLLLRRHDDFFECDVVFCICRVRADDRRKQQRYAATGE